jgi:putative flippase GtrA
VSGLRQFGRHQLVAVAATALDYLVMIAMVSGLGLNPVEGTVVGAAVGAFTSFSLGRRWTFQATHRAAYAQAWRYALVSAASLGFNALGEHVFHALVGLQYVLARVITSAIVSVGWNFPLHRYFVFR